MKYDSIKAASLVIVTIGFILFGAWAGYKNWTTGGSESDYEIICLGGHQYHRANWSNKALLGIRLHDDGTPVKCN